MHPGTIIEFDKPVSNNNKKKPNTLQKPYENKPKYKNQSYKQIKK